MKARLLTLFLLSSLGALGQRDMLISQMMLANSYNNPAATGFSEKYEAALFYRHQWSGLEGSPRSLVFSLTKNLKGGRSTLGATLSSDRLGVAHTTGNFKLLYAYHVPLEKVRLSFGLAAGVMNTAFRGSRHQWEDPSDELAAQEDRVEVKPDFNLGVELQTNAHFVFGASMIHFAKSRGRDGTFTPHEHFRTYVEQRFELSEKWNITPALIYLRGNSLNMFELSARLQYTDMIWMSLAYRPLNAYGLGAGLRFGMFRVGYVFEIAAINATFHSPSTQEFFVAMSL